MPITHSYDLITKSTLINYLKFEFLRNLKASSLRYNEVHEQKQITGTTLSGKIPI